MVEKLSKKVDRVVGDDIGDLKETDIECGHNKLHEIVAEGHLLYLLLALISHQFAHLLSQLLSSRLHLSVALNLLLHCVLFTPQTLLVFLCSELSVLLKEGVLREKVIVGSSVLHGKIRTLSI